MDEDAILREPMPVEGRSVPVELVDFSAEVLPYLKAVDRVRDIMGLLAFDFREPLLIPHPDALVAKTFWSGREEIWRRLETEFSFTRQTMFR